MQHNLHDCVMLFCNITPSGMLLRTLSTPQSGSIARTKWLRFLVMSNIRKLVSVTSFAKIHIRTATAIAIFRQNDADRPTRARYLVLWKLSSPSHLVLGSKVLLLRGYIFFLADCPAGSYSTLANRTCILCPRGSYQPERGRISCILCGINLTTLSHGKVNEAQCIGK